MKSSPDAHVTIVAPAIHPDVEALASISEHDIKIIRRPFSPADVKGMNLVVAATNIGGLNDLVYQCAKQERILVNVADTPSKCDFYMGAIVTKGDLKIAISTNGSSPTLAKRLREWLESELPDEIDTLLYTLKNYRSQLKLSFEEKVQHIQSLTEGLLHQNKTQR